MTCIRIDERLLQLTAPDHIPEFSAEEREHIGTCARCRELVAETTGSYSRIARSSTEHRPDPTYWTSILPRIRERSGRSESRVAWPVTPGTARAFMPAAAVIVFAILLSVIAVEPPVDVTAGEILATLSDAELYELRQSGKYTGLLEPAETNGEEETSLADFIADLLSENGQERIYALVDPEEVLHQVDDAQFTEIVSNLEIK